MRKATKKSKKLNGGPDGRLIKREDSVLVVIDVQERLVPVISNHNKMIANIVKLIRFAEIIGMPVVMTEQEKLGATVKEIKIELTDLVPITKIEFSVWKCSKFVKKLNQLSRSNVILVGVETHICIAQTALELLPNFNVHVISDATSSRSEENKDIALQRLNQSGVVVSSTEMVIYELMGRAGTEEFKKVLSLIK
ncbi:MAG: hydrolase [Actinomycetota bacterium]|nr:hydrolase [Actinomycetota bacterium]